MVDDVVILEDAPASGATGSDTVSLSETPAETAAAPVPAPAETAAAPAADPGAVDLPVVEEDPNRERKNTGVADLVFLIDITGSMGSCIDALRNNINKFIDTLTSTVGNGSPITDWRARFVGYRDYVYDGPTSYGWLEDNPFTRDVNALRNQLAAFVAKGGGPGEEGIPESLLDAMMTVATAGAIDPQAGESDENTNKWRVPGTAARFIIVFTDATFHPTMSIPGYEGATIRDLNNVLRQERVKPYFFVPSDPSYAMLGRMRGAVLKECGAGGDGLLSVTSNQALFLEMLEKLAEGVTKTASSPVILK